MMLSLGFAGIALLLTALGLYGVLARSVTLRTREIGVRVALGARQQDMFVLVIRDGVKLVLLGGGLGLAVSLAATRLLRTLLFGVSATEPWMLIGVVAVLLWIAFPACYIPARRATRVDPMVALRHE